MMDAAARRLVIAKMICPDTHVIVPREPTDAMLKAACASMSPGKRPTQEWVPVKQKHRIRFKAMVEAAE